MTGKNVTAAGRMPMLLDKSLDIEGLTRSRRERDQVTDDLAAVDGQSSHSTDRTLGLADGDVCSGPRGIVG